MPKQPSAKKILSSFSLVLLFVGIIGYGLWRAGDMLFGITLAVHNISNGQSVQQSLFTLSGKAHHAASVAVDGTTIPIDLDGNWSREVALLPGYNHVTVSAEDKFHKTITKDYVVYYDAPVAAASPTPALNDTSTKAAPDTADTTKNDTTTAQDSTAVPIPVNDTTQSASVLDATKAADVSGAADTNSSH